ncbi:hypothetical protein H312_01090 [Anncaliia algerae PRA339]|uniref:DM2 domain-containing protein n=1 Tax=Anncaliia algerae PRA339 TaxID=1288291 RepID=A0A059F342_9MICR|nr:hypothetical protein H312_01090 [Anncaliia algerae PRA339]
MEEEKLKTLEKSLDEAVLKHRLLIEENHCQRIKCKKRLRLFIETNAIKTKVINDYINNITLHGSDLIKRIYLVENDRIIREYLCGDEKVDNFYLEKEVKKTDLVYKSTLEEQNNSTNILKEMNLISENNEPIKSTEENIKRKVLIELKDLGIYKIKPKLSQLLNKKTGNKTNILISIWKYVHNKKIIRNGKIYCNEELKEILNIEKINIESINLINLIEPLDLVEIPLEKEIYDIEVELDDLVDFPILYQSKVISQLNRKTDEIKEIINMVEDRIKILKEFVEKGETFIDEHSLDDKRAFFYDPYVQEMVYNLSQHMK